MRYKQYEPVLFLGPGMLFLFIFIIVPVLFLFVLSFFHWDMFSGVYRFTGFDNYVKMFRDPVLLKALINTGIYVFFVLFVSIAASLFLAVLLNRKMLGFGFYRTAFFLPVVLSLAASGIVWVWIYDYNNGILNHLIGYLGFDKVNWLGDTDTALFSVIIMTLWKRVGYNMVIFLAGLQVIPPSLYEAAEIDGAGSFDRFRYITWPNLLPTTSFILIINLIFSFRDFAQIYVMTGGGPLDSTTTLVFYIYETAFKEFNVGYAAAISMLLFAVVMAITFIKLHYFSKEEKEQFDEI